MRQGQNLKRPRGQRRKQNGGANRTLDSTGPDIKIRGSASHIYEKYLQLSRDHNTSGDRVKAENYLQHAEHYFRLMRASQPAPAPSQPFVEETQQDASSEERVRTDAPKPNGEAPAQDAPSAETPPAEAPPAAEAAEERPARAPRRKRVRRAASDDAPRAKRDAEEEREPEAPREEAVAS
ncbi:MAG: DUF4167 domain-containing protein [Pseudomonadota bacterium]